MKSRHVSHRCKMRICHQRAQFTLDLKGEADDRWENVTKVGEHHLGAELTEDLNDESEKRPPLIRKH